MLFVRHASWSTRAHRLFLVLPVIGVLSACSDSAIAPRVQPPADVSTRFDVPLRCTAQVKSGAVTCVEDRAAAATETTGDKSTAIRRDLILGGQGTYINLASSNVAYSSGTGVFSFNVTVQNLIPQPLATTDGTTETADGIRVFFAESPVATALTDPEGSSAISITNADGTGTFTAAGQPYYQYTSGGNGLDSGEVTPSRTWTFNVDPNVVSFEFLVYVNAQVQYPTGYVTGLPRVLTLDPAESFTVTPVVRNAEGTPLSGQSVTYTSSAPSLVSAAADGTMTAGTSRGTGTITAESGSRPGLTSAVFSVCQSTVVASGTSLPASISSSDCFSSFSNPGGFPTTNYYADLYRVTLTAGQTVTITLNTGDDLDTVLYLASRDGVLVASNDDDDTGNLGVGSRVVYTATQSGVYVIEATTYSGHDTGNYTLGVTIS